MVTPDVMLVDVVAVVMDRGDMANGVDIERVIEEEQEELTLEERADVIEETGPQRVESNWQCGDCGTVYNGEYDLNGNITQRNPGASQQSYCSHT